MYKISTSERLNRVQKCNLKPAENVLCSQLGKNMISNVFKIWAVESFMYPHLYSIPCVAKRSFTFLACILNLLLLSTSESLALPNQFVVQSQGENSTCIANINSNSNKFWKVILNIFYVEFFSRINCEKLILQQV